MEEHEKKLICELENTEAAMNGKQFGEYCEQADESQIVVEPGRDAHSSSSLAVLDKLEEKRNELVLWSSLSQVSLILLALFSL